MKNEETKHFEFQNQRQVKIHTALSQIIGTAPATFFKDACKIMQDEYDLETKTNLIGHLLREVLSWIIEIMLPIGYEKPETEENYKEKIKDAAVTYGIDQNDKNIKFWSDKIAGEGGIQKWTHKGSMESVRPIDQEFLDIWNKAELLLDFLLNKIEANYLLYPKQIDKIIAKQNISKKDIKALKRHVPFNQTTLSYFFDKLDKPSFLVPLKKGGLFKYPRKPMLHEDGGISFPLWPQMTYLIKMSNDQTAQDEVIQICLEIETENINTQAQILEVALNVPPDKSLKIAQKSLAWIDQIKPYFHAEKYAELLTHLADGGYKKETIELASKLLAIKADPRKPQKFDGHTFPYEPISQIDEWRYGEILKKTYPKIVDKFGSDAVQVLLDLLQDYIELSDKDRNSGSKDDYSYIWRPAIENHSQNHNHGIRDSLIDAIRDSCENILRAKPNQIDKILKNLDDRKLSIFRRLGLHFLREFSGGAKKRIKSELMNAEEFKGEARLTHEYYLLAEKHAKILNKEQKEQIWSWAINGANVEEFIEWKKQNGRIPKGEEVEKYKKGWQMYHLLPFKGIDSKWDRYIADLVSAVGEPQFPSFRSWSSGGSFGPTSVVSKKQLEKMPPEEIIKYLEKWEPIPNDPLDRSREGTGRELTDLISANPKNWEPSLPNISSLDPTYVRSVLQGFREALKQNREFNWEPVLNLCKNVLSKPIKIKDRKPTSLFGDDPDWNLSRNNIIELINDGLKRELPIKFRKDVWSIIEELTKDPDPTPEYEKEYLNNSDPLTLAINTTRGDAMTAAIEYGVWLKNSLGKEDQEKWTLNKNAPELLKVLDDHLNTDIDPSLAIRSVYGQRLGAIAWLDKRWVAVNETRIFPTGKVNQPYFNSAWETYIVFVRPFKDLLRIFKAQYERAIEEIGKHDDHQHHLESPDQMLVHHLIIFYWNKQIELKSTSFLGDFYNTVPIELKAEAVDFIGRAMNDNAKMPESYIKRSKALIEDRLTKLQKSKKPQEDVKEFKDFSWWVASEKFDDGWTLMVLEQILKKGCELDGDHLVIEKFEKIAEKFPLEVINCANLIFRNDKKCWGMPTWGDRLKAIIQTVLKIKNRKTKEAAKEFVNRLVAKGHMEFKDLIS